MSARRELLLLALLFLAAFALRLATVLQYTRGHPQAEHLVIDEDSYERWALEISGGDWIGHAVFFQEPLYPYSIGCVYALFGADRLLVRVLQAALGAVACVLAASLGKRCFGAGAGLVGGALLALHRPALLLPCLFLKANLVLPLLALFALLLVGAEVERRGRWLLLGFLAGLGALLRGNVLVLAPLFVLWPIGRALLERRGARAGFLSALACAGGVALALGPVALRNWKVGGVLALTTSGAGTNVYGGNNLENPNGVATELAFVRGIPRYEADDWRREAERRVGHPLDAGEVSRFWLAETWRSVRAHPLEHLAILWRKLRLTLGAHEVPDNHSLAWDARYVPLLRWPWPGFAFTGSLGLAGFSWFVTRRRASIERRRGLELALLFGLYLATIVLTVTSMRARMPLVPLLVPFAGLFVVELVRALREPRRLIGRAACLAPAALFVCVPVLDRDALARELAGRDYNHAVQLVEAEDRPRDALPIAEALARRDPGNPRFQTLLANVEWRLGSASRAEGREEEGRALVRSALARLESVVKSDRTGPRELARASRLAGWIQLELGSFAAAERHFRRARAFAPDDPELALEHARALVELARRAEPGPERDAYATQARALLELAPPGREVDALRARLP